MAARPERERLTFGEVVALAGCLLATLCTGCNTVEALTSAPPSFWETGELILVAAWEDLWSVIDAVVGLVL